MNENELATEVTKLEGGKISCSIAQVKEVLKCFKLVMVKDATPIMLMGPDENKYLCFPMHSLIAKMYKSGVSLAEKKKKVGLFKRIVGKK